MTKDQIINFRDVIGKDKILKIVCDNQIIFYDNLAQYPPIIWDDANETITAVRVNQDPNGQVKYPFETVQTSYDHVQFMHCYDTSSNAVDIMNTLGSNLTEDQKTHFKKYLSESSANRKTWGRNYNMNMNETDEK